MVSNALDINLSFCLLVTPTLYVLKDLRFTNFYLFVVKVKLLSDIRKKIVFSSIISVYGTTEAMCISVTIHSKRIKPGSVGMLMPNIEAKVITFVLFQKYLVGAGYKLILHE